MTARVLRLALIGPSWPLRGGIARTTTALADSLACRGSLAAFLVPERQYPRWLYPGSHDRDPAACPSLPAADACFGVLEPWTWRTLLRRARAARPDALVVPYWTWAWAPLWLLLLRARIAPAIAVVHNPADHDASTLARRAARAVLRRCSGYLCHAESVRSAVAVFRRTAPSAVHPIPPGKCATIDRGAARARFGLTEQDVVALCFGLIRPYKGVDVLLDAVAQLPAAVPIKVLLAGEPWGDLGKRIASRFAQGGLAGRMHMKLEWVREDEAPTWFAASDLAVLPYRSATGSAVAAQALGYGLPIIGSAVGGIAEVVEHDVSGVLVPPGDASALSAALAQVADAGLRGRLAAGARAAAQRWTWSSYAATLEALASQVLDAAADNQAS